MFAPANTHNPSVIVKDDTVEIERISYNYWEMDGPKLNYITGKETDVLSGESLLYLKEFMKHNYNYSINSNMIKAYSSGINMYGNSYGPLGWSFYIFRNGVNLLITHGSGAFYSAAEIITSPVEFHK